MWLIVKIIFMDMLPLALTFQDFPSLYLVAAKDFSHHIPTLSDAITTYKP
jgi:hypothetical protein